MKKLREFFMNENEKSEAPNLFVQALVPRTEFLPGSMLANNKEAMEAVKKNVEKKIAELNPDSKVEWEGTIGKVLVNSKIVNEIEVHGATYDREKKEAYGVRVDLSGIAGYS
jgi:hypothetical protein